MIIKDVSIKITFIIDYTVENKSYIHECYKIDDLKTFINWIIEKQGVIDKIKIK